MEDVRVQLRYHHHEQERTPPGLLPFGRGERGMVAVSTCIQDAIGCSRCAEWGCFPIATIFRRGTVCIMIGIPGGVPERKESMKKTLAILAAAVFLAGCSTNNSDRSGRGGVGDTGTGTAGTYGAQGGVGTYNNTTPAPNNSSAPGSTGTGASGTYGGASGSTGTGSTGTGTGTSGSGRTSGSTGNP
jgi:hypothetical protein